MRRTTVTVILTALLTLFSCVGIFASPRVASVAEDDGRASDGNAIARVEAYLNEAFAKTRFPSASVIIVDGDGVLFSGNYGGCKSSDTPFVLGSVTKTFTALCIMQLVEEGKVELNAKISKYLPSARHGDEITVLQLLNHTGGLGEYHTLKSYKITGAQGKHVYANVNYTLLGKIIESVSGQTYEEFVTRRVFGRLGMTKSAVTYEKSLKNGLIDGYSNYFGASVKTKPHYPKGDESWISAPAGYISSSANDLGKYLQAYLNGGSGANGSVLSQGGIEAMFSMGVRVEDDGAPYEYCLGWNRIGEPMSETVMRHSGLVETGMACVYVLPESNVGIAVLVNANDYFVGKDFMDRLDWSIPSILTGAQPDVIGGGEYALAHAMYDLAYLAVFAISVLPLCLIALWFKGRKRLKPVTLLLIEASAHVLLPTFILLIPLLCFGVPLWVVKSFVPDMFITVLASALALYLTGALKAVLYALAEKGVINSENKEKLKEE